MSETVRIELLPLGRSLEIERGSPLQDALFAQGVEFPCGGHGRCKGCRVRVLAGRLPVTADEATLLDPASLAAGWRLACRARAETDLTLELAQWEASILTDERAFSFAPRDGHGVAVDIGTTTLAAQLLDLRGGEVRAVRTALNAQARHGADIMSRIEFAARGGGSGELTRVIRAQTGELVGALVEEAGAGELAEIVLVGNTAMHHLFGGLDVEPLSRFPFEPEQCGLLRFSASELGWSLPGDPPVRFLPCLGGFVGSDLLAGLLATGLAESEELEALVDLGTNGEIVVGRGGRLLCASTAAGPAFEGARIGQGMRAVTGAIAGVEVDANGSLHCRVLGGGKARGICGSGLVDAVAAGLATGRIDSQGRLQGGAEAIELAPPVRLTQRDIRELQLAKGAIAAGLRLLLEQWGAGLADLRRIHLAGAFGNYVDLASARRIGLLPSGFSAVVPAGNTALLGAKLALCAGNDPDPAFAGLLAGVRHVSLADDERFQDIFVEEMGFAPSLNG